MVEKKPRRKAMMDALRGIHPDVVEKYFPGEDRANFEESADKFIGKMLSFDNNQKRLIPISGEYLLSEFGALCRKLPELICSIVFIGRLDAGLMFRRIWENPADTNPKWDECTFTTIIEAEQLLRSCTENLVQALGPDEEKELAYSEIMPKLLKLKKSRTYPDIRGIYGLFYSEFRVLLVGLYPEMNRDFAFDSNQIPNIETWIDLRPYHFPMLDRLLGTTLKRYLKGNYFAEIKKAIDVLKSLRNRLPGWIDGTEVEVVYDIIGHPADSDKSDPDEKMSALGGTYILKVEDFDISSQESQIQPRHMRLFGNQTTTSEALTAKDTEYLTRLGDDYGIVARSKPMLSIFKDIETYANSKLTILLLGERGVGKELVAKAIHRESKRTGKFIPVDCSSIPETLFESELFGYEKGAFTGADKAKQGLLETANGGTIFFDEIGDMPLEMQAKLRRITQESKIRPIGATLDIHIDVKFICATNVDIDVDVAAGSGRFMPDLYDRISNLTIRIPPLRDRTSDIPALCHHFFQKYCSLEDAQFDFNVDNKTFEVALTIDFPGNIRELDSIIHRMVVWLKSQTNPSSASIAQYLVGDLSSDLDGDVDSLLTAEDRKLLTAYFSNQMQDKATARMLSGKDTKRDTVQRTINSIFLKVGAKYNFESSESATALLRACGVEDSTYLPLRDKINSRYIYLAQQYAMQKPKKIYNKKDVPFIKLLLAARPDLKT